MSGIIDIIVPLEQEGTQAVIKGWYKKVGESVTEGEPLVELETDKVAVEIPAPANGVLQEILAQVDEAAEPGACLGRLNAGASAGDTDIDHPNTGHGDGSIAPQPRENLSSQDNSSRGDWGKDGVPLKERRLSPSVRRLVTENGLDPQLIHGTGRDGRLTRADVIAFIAAGGHSKAAAGATGSQAKRASGQAAHMGAVGVPGGSYMIPHDNMRRRIADHMSHSVATAPHVTAIFEADFSAIMAHRKAHKEDFAARGVRLTYTAYFLAACVSAMRAVPTVNSRWHDDQLEVFNDINIGVGTAIGSKEGDKAENKGLIVPVVRNCQDLSLFGTAQALDHMTKKARTHSLAPGDVRGGTFTISNHGTSGSLVASPIIINQPQSAILGVGKLEKRVVVKTIGGADTIQIRPMAFVSLTIDHRVIDGAQTNAWLSEFVNVLENWPSA